MDLFRVGLSPICGRYVCGAKPGSPYSAAAGSPIIDRGFGVFGIAAVPNLT